MNYNTEGVKAGRKISHIEQHLREHGRITHIQALDLYGMYRLADAVHKMRKRGMEIQTEMEKSQTGSTYAVYTYQEPQQTTGVQHG